MPELKVPFAVDGSTGMIVNACNASKSASYICLDCSRPLVLRDGVVKQKHFAHPPTGHPGCHGESLIHLAAKKTLACQIRRELEEAGRIFYQQNCPGIGKKGCQQKSLVTGERSIQSWTEVKLEVAYKTFRLDVAILNGSEVVYGFEVFHRHKVPELKGQQIKIRWMELVAEDILAFKPRIPFGYETSSSLCPDCIELKAYLAARKPEDLKRSKTSEEHSKAAQKLRRTWHGIVEEARNFDREMRSVSD